MRVMAEVDDEPFQQGTEVMRVPERIDISFTKADVSEEHRAGEKGTFMDVQISGHLSIGCAKAMRGAIGQRELEPAVLEAAEGAQEEPLQEAWDARERAGNEPWLADKTGIHGGGVVMELCGRRTLRWSSGFAAFE